MTSFVDHNIAVVSILDLENITHYRVSGQTPDKVVPGGSELFGILISIFFQEIRVEVNLERFSKLISAVGVWNALNNSSKHFVSTCSIADAFIRVNEQIKIAGFEDFLE
jgi:hypothetical protein